MQQQSVTTLTFKVFFYGKIEEVNRVPALRTTILSLGLQPIAIISGPLTFNLYIF